MAKTWRNHEYRNYPNSLSQWVIVSYALRTMHLIWIEAKEELWSTISILHPLKEQWVWTAPRSEHLLWALIFFYFIFKKRPQCLSSLPVLGPRSPGTCSAFLFTYPCKTQPQEGEYQASPSKQCSYIHECQRVGVLLPNLLSPATGKQGSV